MWERKENSWEMKFLRYSAPQWKRLEVEGGMILHFLILSHNHCNILFLSFKEHQMSFRLFLYQLPQKGMCCFTRLSNTINQIWSQMILPFFWVTERESRKCWSHCVEGIWRIFLKITFTFSTVSQVSSCEDFSPRHAPAPARFLDFVWKTRPLSFFLTFTLFPRLLFDGWPNSAQLDDPSTEFCARNMSLYTGIVKILRRLTAKRFKKSCGIFQGDLFLQGEKWHPPRVSHRGLGHTADLHQFQPW